MSDERLPVPVAPMIALAIAVIGSTTLLVVDHGPFSRSGVSVTRVLAASSAAERKAGVIVEPTEHLPSYGVRSVSDVEVK